jgi:zinc protease
VSGIPDNGSTSNDRTNYYEVVPPNYLETILWIESDRMGYLLDKLDSAKFVAQRDIVQNERRQGVDNQPYGRANEITTVALYPESNPYSWPVVGYLSDLQRASVEDVKNFFRTYYSPGNATIAIVGDFDPKQAAALVRKYFTDLPKGPAITRPAVRMPVLTSEKRLVYEDRVQLPRLYMRWPTTGITGADDDALNMLSSILSGSRTARLTKALVYDLQSAANVAAFQNGNESAGDFMLFANPRAGHTLGELETQIDSVIRRVQREGPTAEEMQKAKASLEFDFVSNLESNLGKAELLNSSRVFYGDVNHYKKQYAALQAVTAEDVKRVANKYLGVNRVVLSVVPLGKTDLAAKPEKSVKVTVSPDGGHYIIGSKQ